MGGYCFELISVPYSRMSGPPQHGGWPQVNQDLHFVHTLEGKGALRVGDRIYPTDPTRVLAVPTRQLCLWDKTDGLDWVMINFHYQVTLEGGEGLGERLAMPVVFCPEGLAAIHRNLRRWNEQWAGGDVLVKLEVAAQVQALVSQYWSDHGVAVKKTRPQDELAQRVREWIERRPDVAFDAAELAGTVNLSVSQMNRRFRAAWGVSPKVYWQHQRAGACRRALRERSETLEQLAPILGFNDAYYFSRWFRRQVGMTPGEYRRRSRAWRI